MSTSHHCPQTSLTKVRPLASLKVKGLQTLKLATHIPVPLQTRMDRIQAGVPSRGDSKASHLGRQVEKGILESPQPMVISLKFERFPIWLLTLDSMQIMEVYIMGFATQDDFNLHVTTEGSDQQLINATIRNVGASKVNFTTNDIPAAGSAYLVSGSKSFV
jgi:hypothetical protein